MWYIDAIEDSAIIQKENKMPYITVNSVDDPELDIYMRFTENQLRNRLDPDNAVFIAESPNVIRTALDVGLEPLSLLCAEDHLDGVSDIVYRAGDIPVYLLPRELAASVKGFALKRGLHCAMRRPAPYTPDEVLKGSRRIAILENTVDPVNLGAIFRSAAALNIDGILLTPSCSDPLVRRAVRVSMGTVLQIPWAYLPDELCGGGTELLHAHGFKTVAMALSKNSVWIDDEALKREEKLAIVLGTEGDGLKPETIASCDYVAKIPMYNGVDSLNVANAATLAFWELRAR